MVHSLWTNRYALGTCSEMKIKTVWVREANDNYRSAETPESSEEGGRKPPNLWKLVKFLGKRAATLLAEMPPQNLWHPRSYQINSLGWMRSQWIPNEVAVMGQLIQLLHKQCSAAGPLPLAPFACLQALWGRQLIWGVATEMSECLFERVIAEQCLVGAWRHLEAKALQEFGSQPLGLKQEDWGCQRQLSPLALAQDLSLQMFWAYVSLIWLPITYGVVVRDWNQRKPWKLKVFGDNSFCSLGFNSEHITRQLGVYEQSVSSLSEPVSLFIKFILQSVGGGLPWQSNGWDSVLPMQGGTGLIPGWGGSHMLDGVPLAPKVEVGGLEIECTDTLKVLSMW